MENLFSGPYRCYHFIMIGENSLTSDWFSISVRFKLIADSRRGKRKERKTITYQETLCARGPPCRAVSRSNEDDNKIQSQSEERGRCECLCMYGYVAFVRLHSVKLKGKKFQRDQAYFKLKEIAHCLDFQSVAIVIIRDCLLWEILG